MIGLILSLFIAGWATQGMTLFDVGRYSFPLILFAAIPFCLQFNIRSSGFLMLTTISSIFAVVVGLLDGAQPSRVASQAFLQCLAIIFAGGVASINWRLHLDTLAASSVGLGIPIVLYGGYQMVARALHLPFAFLPITNQQYYIDGGLQRDWDKAVATRASSFFSEPSEFGIFCLWLIALGLSRKSGPMQVMALMLGCAGIFFSQSLSALLGAIVLMLVYLFSHRVSTQTIRQLAIVGLVATAAIGLMRVLVPEGFDRLTDRVAQAANLDDRADSGRIDHLPACWRIFSESPIWGHGISSLSAASSSGSDSTTIGYAMVLMERGIVGTALFFLPWFTITAKAWLSPVTRQGRSVALLLMVVTLYSYCTLSLTYFLPFWLAFGIAASLVTGGYAEKTEESRITSRPPRIARSPGYQRPPIGV
jgi:O-Antigen ligase